MINMQDKFKQWHYEQHHVYVTGHELWGLQAAIVEQFQQFLDKTETLNRWSRPLHYSYNTETNKKIQSMINYAIHDCLAVTKLASLIYKGIVCIIVIFFFFFRFPCIFISCQLFSFFFFV